jgi:hypothetical protein
MDTWTIPINDNANRISITPHNLTKVQREERKKYTAKIIDVDMEIGSRKYMKT